MYESEQNIRQWNIQVRQLSRIAYIPTCRYPLGCIASVVTGQSVTSGLRLSNALPTFFTFGLGANPWAKVHQNMRWPVTHPGLPSCHISSPCINPCRRYPLQNFADKQRKKERNSKRYIPACLSARGDSKRNCLMTNWERKCITAVYIEVPYRGFCNFSSCSRDWTVKPDFYYSRMPIGMLGIYRLLLLTLFVWQDDRHGWVAGHLPFWWTLAQGWAPKSKKLKKFVSSCRNELTPWRVGLCSVRGIGTWGYTPVGITGVLVCLFVLKFQRSFSVWTHGHRSSYELQAMVFTRLLYFYFTSGRLCDTIYRRCDAPVIWLTVVTTKSCRNDCSQHSAFSSTGIPSERKPTIPSRGKRL